MQNISSIKTRILEYIDFRSITKYEFYKNSGITRSVLDKDSGISETNIIKFLAYAPEVSLGWLIKGEGEMFTDPDDFIIEEPYATYKKATLHRVPLYHVEESSGLVSIFEGKSNPLNHISIPNLPKCDGAVVVTGDGMYPYLKSGDIVLYKKIQNIEENLIWGEIYLISIDIDGEEYVSVRWIQKSDKGQHYIKLVSKNEQHQDKHIHINRVLALGLIKASIRFNTMQ